MSPKLRPSHSFKLQPMNERLLHTDVQEFIRNYDGDIASLAFKGSPFEGISISELLQQIEGYRKCAQKLPTWYAAENTLFPPKLNLEQTSSEITATYKASIVKGTSMADLTGGFGVDAYFFAKQFKTVLHVEHNDELSLLAAHNFNMLAANNIECLTGDGLDGMKDRRFDLIYLDPARRHESKGKVFFLSDCEPNVVEHLDLLLKHAPTLLIKTSPMLDLSVGLNDLKQVQEIHIVAVNNEVKELLWLISAAPKLPLKIHTINFGQGSPQQFHFTYGLDMSAAYSEPNTYLYEPNAAILKAGAFHEVAQAFAVLKLAPHAHLYTSDKLIEFPGRRFKIREVLPYKKATMKSFIKTKANITTRNFPESVVQLRNKWKIQEGGDSYLFFTSLQNGEKVLLVTEKVIETSAF